MQRIAVEDGCQDMWLLWVRRTQPEEIGGGIVVYLGLGRVALLDT